VPGLLPHVPRIAQHACFDSPAVLESILTAVSERRAWLPRLRPPVVAADWF
jgi:hypothetical protein